MSLFGYGFGFLSSAASSSLFSSPSEIADLSLWYDGADESTQTLSGSKVSVWSNKASGNPAAFIGPAIQEPTQVQNAVGSNTAIEFFGSEALIAGANDFVNGGPHTMFLVFKPGAATNQRIFQVSRFDNRWYMFDTSGSNIRYNLLAGAPDPASDIIALPTVVGQVTLAEARETSSADRGFSINGGAETTSSVVVTPTIQGSFEKTTIGRSETGIFPYTGLICEILVYLRALNGEERQWIRNYLSTKWGFVLI
jgi:hypothetical protein